MKLKRIIAAATVASVALTSAAVPARRDLRTVRQADGTEIQIRTVGDENLHFTITADGYMVTLGPDGNYYYAKVLADGSRLSTGVKVSASPGITPGTVATKLSDIDTRALYNARLKSPRSRVARRAQSVRNTTSATSSTSNPYLGLGLTNTGFPTQGDVRALVILVQYSDVKFTLPNPAAYFNDMINGENFTQYGGTGSAVKYFHDVSMGKFRPRFDVLGPVTLPQKRAYYGGNDYWGDDLAPEEMVVDAFKILDPTHDFSVYDMNNDGVLDNVYIIYAGEGEASANDIEDTVWPHSWDLSSAGKGFKADGLTVEHYACSNEWFDNRPDGIGTFVHEFSHVMGLPDLYSTEYDESTYYITPGSYSVLDYGPYNNDGCTPPSYSAYERNAMGWLDATVLNTNLTVNLPEIQASNTACIIPTNSKTEFFLLENRQNTSWDTYLPGHGMLVWHIDYNKTIFDKNEVNNYTHQYVDIEEACGQAHNGNSTIMAGYTFPGTSSKTEFTAESTPALRTWDGNAVEMPITAIREENGIITFLADGGTNRLEAPVAHEQPEVGANYFVAAWDSVDGATDYLLTVTGVTPGAVETETANMGASKTFKLPGGWTSSSTDNYNTSGNYGEASPSYKMSKTDAYLQTRTYTGDITGVKFWIKGQQASGSTLSLLGFDGNAWNVVKIITPKQNTSETITIDNIPAGTKALKFVYTKVKGNLAIDDVVVTTGSASRVIDGFNAVSTGGLTSKRVPAVDGIVQYSYSVVAVDGDRRSRPSQNIEVTLATQGVTGITVDNAHDNAPVQYFNLQGVEIPANSLTPGLYIRRQGKATTKIIVK